MAIVMTRYYLLSAEEFTDKKSSLGFYDTMVKLLSTVHEVLFRENALSSDEWNRMFSMMYCVVLSRKYTLDIKRNQRTTHTSSLIDRTPQTVSWRTRRTLYATSIQCAWHLVQSAFHLSIKFAVPYTRGVKMIIRGPGALCHRECTRKNPLLHAAPVNLLPPHLCQQSNNFVLLLLGQCRVSNGIESTGMGKVNY